jgi:hypothetical protein
MQQADHGDQVRAVIAEPQVSRVHEPPFDDCMAREDRLRQLELLAARVHKRHAIRIAGQDYAEPSEATADVNRGAEPAPVEQTPYCNDLGLMLVIAALTAVQADNHGRIIPDGNFVRTWSSD